mmetsp:Transcript_19294/g.28899  ORF Transcript_19294/g.28899 Transcript_19294/m.28899 type:complete len:88 (-) Transcript_19294:220-483(-)
MVFRMTRYSGHRTIEVCGSPSDECLSFDSLVAIEEVGLDGVARDVCMQCIVAILELKIDGVVCAVQDDNSNLVVRPKDGNCFQTVLG